MKIYKGIKQLITCQGIAKKSGRRVQEKDLSIIPNGAIIEDKGTILWVGKESKIQDVLKSLVVNRSSVKATEYDLNARCVLPGLIDCHTHMIFSGNRRNEFELRNRGATYQQITRAGGGILSTVKATNKATSSDLLKLGETRALNFLKQGVTTVEVKSGYGLNERAELRILEAAKKIKTLRVVSTYLGPHSIPRSQTSDQYMEQILNSTLPKIKKQKLASRVDIFIEKGFFNLKQAKMYFSKSKELGFQMTAHLDQLSRSGGVSDLIKLGLRSVDHLVESSPRDIELLSKADITCVLLPISDFYLQMKYPRARALLDAGARIALSTDFNPGTSPSQSISFLGVLSRLEMKMKLCEVIAALTVGPAHALGIESEEGSLQAQKRCNFVAFDCDYEDLFYSVGVHPVIKVIREGSKVIS